MSKSQIYRWMGTLAAEGKAVIFVSSYIPELLGVCDRVAVFYRGSVVNIKPALEWTPEELTAAATLGRNDSLSGGL